MVSREQVRQAFDETDTWLNVAVNGAIALLILLSAALFAIQTYELPSTVHLVLSIADRVILTLFTVEYLLRLWAAEKPLRFVFSLYGLIDLVAILPFLLGFVDARFLRLIRWLRILRLARFFEEKTWFNRISGTEGLIFARILFTLFSIIFIYSGAIYQAEHNANGEDFVTFLDAVYFAVVTMTTVGYGDITPTTEAGRGLTITMILTGIALIPTQVGNLIQQFTKVKNSVRIACQNCELLGHESDAQFCRRCGAKLFNKESSVEAGNESKVDLSAERPPDSASTPNSPDVAIIP